MYSVDLESAYTYEVERRRDEMRAAVQSQLVHESRAHRRRVPLLTTVLSILVLLSAIFISH